MTAPPLPSDAYGSPPISPLRPRSAASLPAAPPAPDALFLLWLAFCGVLLFAAGLLWRADIWAMLTHADPTGITMLIVVVFCIATAWCGLRSRQLCREQAALQRWRQAGAGPAAMDGSIDEYFRSLHERRAPSAALAEVLSERLLGPHDTAWWVNGIQIKLGLLGKVIGFSILAIQISQIESFDPSQTQTLLKQLTGGLGIALLTTAVGLVANIVLGMQLTRLDRCASGLLADAVHIAETSPMFREAQ